MRSGGGILFLGVGAFILAMAYTGHIRSVWNALIYGDSSGKQTTDSGTKKDGSGTIVSGAVPGSNRAGAVSWAGRVAGPVRPYWQ